MESEELRLLLSPQDCGKRPTSDAWYKRPVGIIFIGVTGTTIALAIRAVLAHWFPNWFR